jgi:hypothetical protein
MATMPVVLAAAWMEPHGAGILLLRIPADASFPDVIPKG